MFGVFFRWVVLFGCPEPVDGSTTAVDARFAALEAEIVALQGQVAGLQAQVDAPPPAPSPTVALVSAPALISVPGDYPSIQDAIDAIDGWWFVGDGEVTVTVADGSYTLTETLRVRHPQGARIRIEGNPADPDAVVLTCEDTCLELTESGLGGFNGFALQAGAAAPATAVVVEGPYRVTLGPTLTVRDFAGNCIVAREGASLVAKGVTVEDCGGAAFLATWGSFADVSQATARRSAGNGLAVSWGASMEATGAILTDGLGAGMTATDTSTLNANGVISQNNDYGINCKANSICAVDNAVITGNDTWDLYAVTGGFIELENTTYGTSDPLVSASDNQLSYISP